ncbi:MAG: hypothetical protein LBK56_10790 [Gracilibacteraceae bacterium]|jgi:hypothetical protein|nr:hypothetical protein [Gracilibacteraceae bacterium]
MRTVNFNARFLIFALLILLLSGCQNQSQTTTLREYYEEFAREYMRATDFLENYYAITVEMVAELDANAMRESLLNLADILEKMEEIQSTANGRDPNVPMGNCQRSYEQLQIIYATTQDLDSLQDEQTRADKFFYFKLIQTNRFFFRSDLETEPEEVFDPAPVPEGAYEEFIRLYAELKRIFIDATEFVVYYDTIPGAMASIPVEELSGDLDDMGALLQKMGEIESRYNNKELRESYEAAAYGLENLEVLHDLTAEIDQIDQDINLRGKCTRYIARIELYRSDILLEWEMEVWDESQGENDVY